MKLRRCGLLLSVSAFSCDITLPAFWSTRADLGTASMFVALMPIGRPPRRSGSFRKCKIRGLQIRGLDVV